MRVGAGQPHAVILPGGRTPRGIYEALAREPVRISRWLRILVSDERHVPLDSPDSNFGMMRDMIRALGIPETHVLRVNTELPLDKAADRYDEALRGYLKKGGRIKLGLLGLGADGHTASLFSGNDIFRGLGRYAVAVKRESGHNRISVTRDLLLKAEQIVFMAAGTDKGEAVHKMTRQPGSIPAGMVVEDMSNVEVWYAP
jgi:6-phosphogluconolactonase